MTPSMNANELAHTIFKFMENEFPEYRAEQIAGAGLLVTDPNTGKKIVVIATEVQL